MPLTSHCFLLYVYSLPQQWSPICRSVFQALRFLHSGFFCQHFCNQNTTKTVLIQRESTAVGLDGGRSAGAAVIQNGWTAWEEKDPGVPSRMLPPGASAGSGVTIRDLELEKDTHGGGGLAWGHEARWLAGQV